MQFRDINEAFAMMSLYFGGSGESSPLIASHTHYVPPMAFYNKKRTYEEYIGAKFGRITVKDIVRIEGKAMAICDCDCGTKDCVIGIHALMQGRTRSCGCLKRDMSRASGPGRRRLNNVVVRTFDNGSKLEIKSSNDDSTFLVDTITWNYLSRFTWYHGDPSKRHGYLYTKVDLRHYTYHGLIVSCPNGYLRDHIDRNPLNNLYENLRVVTPRENVINSGLLATNKSGITGVHYLNTKKVWTASFTWNEPGMPNGRYRTFKTKEDAAAYRKACEEKFRQIHPIETPRLVLPDGTLNRQYPFEAYPDFPWHELGIQLIYV